MNLKKYIKVRKHPSGEEVEEEYNDTNSLLRAYLRLTPEDIYASSGFSPFEIVAGREGVVLNPVAALCNYVGGTVAYDGGSETDTDVQIYIGNPALGITEQLRLTTSPQDFWSGIISSAVTFIPGSGSQVGDPSFDFSGLELNVVLNQGGLALATGDSPLDVWMWYIAHNLRNLF